MILDASRRRATSEPTRTRLLTAAQALFLDRGYEATSVRAVADGAGVTIGAFYGHFGAKRTVLFEVVRVFNVAGRGRKVPFPTPAHRSLLLTVASFAHTDTEAAAVLGEVLQVIAPGVPTGIDPAAAGELLVALTT